MIAPWDGDRINLKIATWNLARVLPKQAARIAKIVRWLDRVDADVWVLTETHNSVSPGPGYSAASTRYPDRPGEPGERWVTIWSRLPIEPLPPARDPARTVAALVQPPHGAPLVVYGTVLPWLGSPWRDFPADDGMAFREPRSATRGLDRPRPPVPGRRSLRDRGPQPRSLPPGLLRVTREPARAPRRAENRWPVRADGRSHRPGASRGAGPGLS